MQEMIKENKIELTNIDVKYLALLSKIKKKPTLYTHKTNKSFEDLINLLNGIEIGLSITNENRSLNFIEFEDYVMDKNGLTWQDYKSLNSEQYAFLFGRNDKERINNYFKCLEKYIFLKYEVHLDDYYDKEI